jgi:hypothetical protein
VLFVSLRCRLSRQFLRSQLITIPQLHQYLIASFASETLIAGFLILLQLQSRAERPDTTSAGEITIVEALIRTSSPMGKLPDNQCLSLPRSPPCDLSPMYEVVGKGQTRAAAHTASTKRGILRPLEVCFFFCIEARSRSCQHAN